MNASSNRLSVTRRQFVQGAGGTLAAAAVGFPGIIAARDRELTISRIIVQEAKGHRQAPSGPNSRGRPPVSGRSDYAESILRIQTAQGLEGICRAPWRPNSERLKGLIGLDPFKMFQFGANERILAPAAQHEALLTELKGCDVALIDLIGKALKRPAASFLGDPARDGVLAYDSSLYMDEFLPSEVLKDLVYIKGPTPKDPVELLARKAEWIVHGRPEGFRAVKIKIGRANFMRTPAEALERDVAITNAIRKSTGPDVKIFVDANRAYWGMPEMAWNYAQGVAESNVYFMEEMFPEEDVVNTIEFKKRLRGIGPIKLAAGESVPGGLAEEVYTQRFSYYGVIDEPLIDVEQGDFNANGFLYLRAKAARQAKLGMTMAPHNHASKLGFYAQVHLGMVTPNWETSEIDDIEFPALIAEGIEFKRGLAAPTGMPGLGVTLSEKHLERPKLEV